MTNKIGEDYENLQEFAGRYWFTEADAQYHIMLYTKKYAFNPSSLEGLFNIVRRNLALALTDPNPYLRKLAEFFAKE
jgi:hypothetical protein